MTQALALNGGLLATCILAEAARELCFKKAADGRTIGEALTDPLVLTGLVCWLVEMVAWIEVLQHVPLSLAFPLTALVYVVIVIGGAVFLKEKVTFQHATGALLIAAGVAWIGVTGL